MADKAVTKHTPLGDFLHHFESAGVCFESGFLKTPLAQAADGLDMLGYPVKGDKDNGWELCVELDTAAGIKGFLLEQGLLNQAANTTSERKVLVLVRGPAVVVEESFPTVDVAGTDFTAANIVAAAEAVGIQMRNIPEKTSVQTT